MNGDEKSTLIIHKVYDSQTRPLLQISKGEVFIHLNRVYIRGEAEANTVVCWNCNDNHPVRLPIDDLVRRVNKAELTVVV